MDPSIPVLPINSSVSTDEVRAMVLRSHFQLLTESDLALMTGLEPRTLTVWRSRGEGPAFVKLGRSVFYHRKSICDWINANLVDPNASTPQNSSSKPHTQKLENSDG